jgi:hypothetical protein
MADLGTPGRAAGANAAEEALTDLLGTFRSEAEATRQAIHVHENNRRRQNRWALAIIAVMAVVLAMVLVILLQNRQKSNQSRQILRNNAVLSEQIADCTTAGGKCYEEGRKQSATAVQQLIRSNLVIAVCARDTTTDAGLMRCVDAKMAELAKPSPTPTS